MTNMNSLVRSGIIFKTKVGCHADVKSLQIKIRYCQGREKHCHLVPYHCLRYRLQNSRILCERARAVVWSQGCTSDQKHVGLSCGI